MSRGVARTIYCHFSIWGLVDSPNTNKARVHDPNLWTYPIICVSTHIERQEADVNTQEFVIPFLTASRPLWENNTVREVTAQESQRLRRWKLWHILIKTFTLRIGTWKSQVNLRASPGLCLILSLISPFFPSVAKKPLRCHFNKLSSFTSWHNLTEPTFELRGNQNKSWITNQVSKTDGLKETLKY